LAPAAAVVVVRTAKLYVRSAAVVIALLELSASLWAAP
jgi:hypothetical protein